MASYSAPGTSTDDGATLLLVGPVVAWLGLWIALVGWHVDDAGITYAYARSLGTGHGFRAWAGGPVAEGFSNPAWTLLLALPAAVGFPIAVASKVLQAAVGALTLVLVHRTVRHAGGERAEGTAAALAAAVCAPWAVWTAGGLETALLSAGLVGFVWAVVTGRSGWIAGTAAAVVALSRPEGPVLAVALIAAAAIADPAWPHRRVAAGLAAAAFAGWLAVRGLVFDAWLPTSWYAKVTGDTLPRIARGALYGGAFAAEIGLPLLALGWGAAWWIRRLAPLARAIAVVVGVDLAVVVAVGGDWMGHGRLLAHLVPLISMASVPGLLALLFRPMDISRPVLGGRAYLAWVLGIAWVGIQVLFWQDAIRHPPLPMDVAGETADLLAALGPPSCGEDAPRFATPDVGAALYRHPEAEVLDLAGLTDAADARGAPGVWPDRLAGGRPQLVLVHGPWVPRTGLDDGVLAAAGYRLLCRRDGTPGPLEDRFPPSLYRRADCVEDPGPALLDRLDAWCTTWR